ncbi:protein translocase subunit SecD [Candidatus Uhrbacteria bacterium CG10_big_fil_rev_8_21_14_0_10_48_11]|uniref:Protein translocase subunit SecD n=1 Tax=Candidatus Uhrbacteria bacterium CG10_big_fil_rev_8_21_14_0_10_48_11 TaxID=1975037 RepID=A0A2M8LED8_9BACT|nr:MAG: protein translocase subunit SecD [Candidatus Uhrbacteria bacterium CG10_big_fil_rev_8_21_14_0_10_48_11]
MGVRVTFRTRRGRVRWTFVAIIVLTIVAGLYNYPVYYNKAVDAVNPKLAELGAKQYPTGLGWVGGVLKAGVPYFVDTPFRLGLDLVGGTQLLYDADTSKIPDSDKVSALEGVRDVIERRVNAFGVAEPVVQTERSGNQWRVLVELAGVENVDDAIKQIGETPLLEFKEQDENAVAPTITPAQQKQIDDGQAAAKRKAESVIKRLNAGEDFAKIAKELSDDPGSKDNGGDLDYITKASVVAEFGDALFNQLKENQITQTPIKTAYGHHVIQRLDERTNSDGVQEVHARHILISAPSARDFLPNDPNAGWKNTQLSGKQLDKATVVFAQQTNQPQVQLRFNAEGSKLFEEITQRDIGKPVGIFLDGQPISVPTVQQAIVGGEAVITGSFTIDEAKLLAQRLNAGALPVPIALVSQQTIGAKLGAVAVQQSLEAAFIGFLLVALFMILYYRLPGLLSVFALLVYASIALALFKFWPVTLTLAGVTGFILSIGMAVDANVLIFERLREELAEARPLQSAIEVGFQRAWTSIRDSNVSSLLTCTILYWFGTSVVRGFALTLALGILVSMFSAIIVTRTFLRLVVANGTSKRLWLYGVARKNNSTEV